MKVTKRLDSTCRHCGFTLRECVCGKRRNTSGDLDQYAYHQNPIDYYNSPDYTHTRRFKNPRDEERKFILEMFPNDRESLTAWSERTRKSMQASIEDSVYLHIWGTSKPWPSHTGDRYCPICILAQQLELMIIFINTLSDLVDLSTLLWSVSIAQDGSKDFTIVKA